MDNDQLQLLNEKALLDLLLDGTDDIVPGSKGDQLRDDFELVEVIDIIPVPVVKCRWGGREHVRFVDPNALVKEKEIRIHKYLVSIAPFIGDRWQAAKEGVRRGSAFIEKMGAKLVEILVGKLQQLAK